ncbi:MAG: helix-turn-helix domain-containing protein, partial [Actinomycetes bacterium]
MTKHTVDPLIGERIDYLRRWRGLTLRELAGLAGCSAGHLSKVIRGLEPCNSRVLINGVATALRVAPSEFLLEPMPGNDPVSREAHEGVEQIGTVLLHNSLGHPYREEACTWPEVAADIRLLVDELHPKCDYVRQVELLPDLIERLYVVHATDPAHRRDALGGLMITIRLAAAVTKNLGSRSAPSLAATHMRY